MLAGAGLAVGVLAAVAVVAAAGVLLGLGVAVLVIAGAGTGVLVLVGVAWAVLVAVGIGTVLVGEFTPPERGTAGVRVAPPLTAAITFVWDGPSLPSAVLTGMKPTVAATNAVKIANIVVRVKFASQGAAATQLQSRRGRSRWTGDRCGEYDSNR